MEYPLCAHKEIPEEKTKTTNSKHHSQGGAGTGPSWAVHGASRTRHALPQALKDRHSWKSGLDTGRARSWELAHCSHPGDRRRPSSEAHAPLGLGATHALGCVQAPLPPCSSGPHLDHMLRARHSGQPQAGKAQLPPGQRLRAIFLTLTLLKSTEPPPEFTKTNARLACPGPSHELPRQARAGRQAQPSESHVALLFREAPECALFWVPRALMLPEAPYPARSLSVPPERAWSFAPASGRLVPPEANAPLATERA